MRFVLGGCLVVDKPGRHSFFGRMGRGAKATAAIRADVLQLVVCAIAAEGAFVRADVRLRRMRVADLCRSTRSSDAVAVP